MTHDKRPTRRQIAGRELRALRGHEDRHLLFHGRLLAIVSISLVVDVVFTLGLAWFDTFSEDGHHSLWKSFGWTSSQMLVGGSSFTAQSIPGHVAEVFLQAYGVFVIAAIAGSFASFFLSSTSASATTAQRLHLSEAFAGLGVDDVPRAKEFYSKTLGFDVVDPPPEVEDPARPAGFQLNLGAGTRVLMYPSPDHRLPTFPVLSLVVKDLGRAVEELRSRGIRFDSDENGSPMDPGSTDRTTDARPVARFRDPAGNVLAILQDRPNFAARRTT